MLICLDFMENSYRLPGL